MGGSDVVQQEVAFTPPPADLHYIRSDVCSEMKIIAKMGD